MRPFGLRRLFFTAGVFLAVLFACSKPASAQNENESVGFQNSHIFESGVFGEQIDTLNGGLTLEVPLGPSFAVSQNLTYQLKLYYNSKIWDRAHADSQARVMGQSPVGLGFRMNFGRIYRDVSKVQRKKSDGSGMQWVVECRWIYVSPDGNEHEMPTLDEPGTVAGCTEGPSRPIADGSFVRQEILSTNETEQLPSLDWDGVSSPAPVPTIRTPDGLRYVFGNFIQVFNASGRPLNSNEDIWPDTVSQRYNKEFGGWYVTRIEDARSGGRAYGAAAFLYDSHVTVEYDNRSGFQHLMTGITDNSGRTINLINDCEHVNPADANSSCRSDSTIPAPNSPIRTSTRVEHVEFPAFGGSTATYDLKYEYRSLTLLGCTGGGCAADVSRNLLKRIVYPLFETNVGLIPETERYKMEFDYNTWGEMLFRQLPTGALISYVYNDYAYVMSGGNGTSYDAEAQARAVETKTVSLPDGRTDSWSYKRDTAYYSNPTTVTVWDPFGNDTVYRFRASRLDSVGFTGNDPEDGFAPEWDDGLNYQVEYYQGHGPSRQLVRTVKRDYTADSAGSVNPKGRARSNIRMWRETTIYNDAGGISTSVAFNDWDGKGHWRHRVETGFTADEYRSIRTQYFGYLPDQWSYQEVSDGRQVLSRTEQLHYGVPTAGVDITFPTRLCATIQRSSSPMSMNGPATFDAADGDITTWFDYDVSSGNALAKSVSDGAHGPLGCSLVNANPSPPEVPCCAIHVTGAPQPKFKARYSWSAGGYLATKEIAKTPAAIPTEYFAWKAIDRTRDANTGLISESRDTAGTLTSYVYDSLGRPREIIPGSGEYRTRVEYIDIAHTSVRQSATTSGLSQYRCDTATGDAVLTCFTYNSLGLLTLTEKRPYSSTQGVAYQRLSYDLDGRKTFESEWRFDPAPSSYCGNPGEEQGHPTCLGTAYDYQVSPASQVIDPFARVHRTTTADSKVTDVSYFGTSSRVTIHDVVGKDGSFDPSTTYYRDGFGQLTFVESPVNTVGGEQVAGGADASYSYDAMGNLVQVDLLEKSGDHEQSRYYEYDPLGRLRRSTTPESGTTVITAYDALGNVLEQVDSAGVRRRSVYDPVGRLTALFKTDPAGTAAGTEIQVLAQSYDVVPAGNPHSFANSGGRLVLSDVRDDEGATILKREYQYSGLNNRLSNERLYFSAFPAQPDGFPLPLEIFTQYGSFGLPTRLQYPEGAAGLGGAFAVNYVYGNGALLRATLDGGVELASLTYNAAGGLKEIATQGLFKTAIAADARNRPLSIEIGRYTQPSGAFVGAREYASGTYSYDGAGNIWRIGDGPQQNLYSYDGANRLVQAKVWSGGLLHDQTFEYDDYGNITIIKQSDFGTPVRDDRFMMTDANEIYGTGRTLNRIHTVEGINTPIRFMNYDARGNLSWNNTGSGVTTSSYDSLNRLSAFSTVNGGATTLIAAYKYDAQGTRVEQHDLNRQLRAYYVRDGEGRLLSEFRRTSLGTYVPEWSKHYLYLGNRLVGLRENTKPSPPGQLNATTDSSGSVFLTWQANPQYENIGFYKVYRTPAIGTPSWTLLGSPTGLTFTDTSAVPMTKYKYQLTASNAAGEGYGSDLTIQSASTHAPTVPNNFRATAGDRRVDVAWDPPILPEFQMVVGYRLYRGSGAPGVCPVITEALKLLDLPQDRRFFADLDVSNDTTYCYAVKAIDAAGHLSVSSTVLERRPADRTPPAPPGAVRAVSDCAGSGAIKISWKMSEPEDGLNLGYTVYRTPTFSQAPSAPTLVPGTNRLEVTDSDTVSGTLYTYWLEAMDAQANVSLPSSRVTAKSKSTADAGIPVVPQAPLVDRIGGVVALKLPNIQGRGARLYRRPNQDASCSAYQLVQELSPDPVNNTLTFLDASAPMNAASNYVATYVDPASGAESAFSKSALSIPVEPPGLFDACLEIRPAPSSPREGDIFCAGSPQTLRRVVLSWSAPESMSYQPLWSTNSSGSFSYIKGYRLYGYVQSGTEVTRDTASLKPYSPARRVGGHCSGHPDVTCSVDSNCPSGDSCRYTTIAPSGSCILGTARSCFSDLDCDAGAQCIVEDDDPSLINDHETRAYLDCVGESCNTCVGVRAVYKVFVDGNWATIESDPSDNMHLDVTDNPLIRCDRYIPELPCQFKMDNSDWDGTLRQCTSDESGPPPVPATPTAESTSVPGEVVLHWTAPAGGKCQLINARQFCTPADPCPPEQFCFPCNSEDPTCELTEGTCQLLEPPSCDPSSVPPACPTGQYCEDEQIAGYRIQVDDYVASNAISRKHHFIYPIGAVTVPASVTSYTFKNLSYEDHFAFRVSTVDARGRTSEPSAFSNPSVSPLPPPAPATGPKPPVAVRAIIWTLNDHVFPSPTLWAAETRRELEGVKITWRPGGTPAPAGFRVYRSTSADGANACLLVRSGSEGHPNPPGETICEDERDGSLGSATAYSETLSSQAEDFSTNKRAVVTDTGILTGLVHYYYVVAVVANGDVSPPSAIVSAMSLPHDSQPLSAPRGFKAWASLKKTPNGDVHPDRGIYLHWCGNPDVEGITAYRIYRWKSLGSPWGPGTSPYATIHMDNPAEAACLDGKHRCELSGNNAPPVTTSCEFPGVEEDCRLVDMNLEYPVDEFPLPLEDQVEVSVYYYAVTAMRGTAESPFSLVNQGWPNYCPPSGPCGLDRRYDPDNLADIACGDENASLMPEGKSEVPQSLAQTSAANLPAGADISSMRVEATTPYRTVGIIQNPNDEGGGGGTPPPPATYRMLYYHLDHLGSPRVIVDSSGAVVSKHDYMPFGEEIPLVPQNSSNPRAFTGHERDSSTEQDYMLARYYAATLGRFTSPDPRAGGIEMPQSLNRYSYAGNNPMSYVDPTGEDFQIPCSDPSDTCGSNGRGGLVKGRTDPETGDFTPTTIKTPDKSQIANGEAQEGQLIDNWGTTYSASYDGTSVTVTTTNQGPSNTIWVPGSPSVKFQNAGPVFNGLDMTITRPGIHQIVRGYVDLPAGVGVAEMMARIGASPMVGIHPGIEFRTSGGGNGGTGSTHYIVKTPDDKKGAVPSTRINFHSGEIDPRVNMLHHGCRDFLKLCS